MYVVITGSRDWVDQKKVIEVLDNIHAETPIKALYHGGARGADQFGRWWARDNGIRTFVFLADWTKYGKAAGPIRNREMLDRAMQTALSGNDKVIVVGFRLNQSRGTSDMLEYANKKGVACTIVDVSERKSDVG